MPNELSEADITALLQPFLLKSSGIPAGLYSQLARYLQLLLKWNARTNLTAIRNPAEIVTRHFGESLFAAQHLGECGTLLDFGSGAGFPGLPVQLFRPEIHVTLSESQNKKAAFLRETVRSLGLETTVWASRVEAMPESVKFDVVTLRAVDNMPNAVAAAAPRVRRKLMLLTTSQASTPEMSGFKKEDAVPIPGSTGKVLLSFVRRSDALFHVEHSPHCL